MWVASAVETFSPAMIGKPTTKNYCTPVTIQGNYCKLLYPSPTCPSYGVLELL